MPDSPGLTRTHIRAIEAQIDLVLDEGDGEVALVIEKNGVRRIVTAYAEVYADAV